MTGRAAAVAWDGPDLVLRLHIQPRARRNEILGLHGDCVKIRINAPPVDGLANARLVAYLAECFGVGKSRVTLLRGHGTRVKMARILSPARVPPELGPVSCDQ